MMTRLVEALAALGLDGEIDLAGQWIKLEGERCAVYVVEVTRARGYYTWCADPQARAVEFYPDPVQAIQAGLRRAAKHGQDKDNDPANSA